MFAFYPKRLWESESIHFEDADENSTFVCVCFLFIFQMKQNNSLASLEEQTSSIWILLLISAWYFSDCWLSFEARVLLLFIQSVKQFGPLLVSCKTIVYKAILRLHIISTSSSLSESIPNPGISQIIDMIFYEFENWSKRNGIWNDIELSEAEHTWWNALRTHSIVMSDLFKS